MERNNLNHNHHNHDISTGCHCSSEHSCGCHEEASACGCGHDHAHTDEKALVIRLIAGGLLFLSALITESYNEYIGTALFIISYIILGYDVVLHALKNILKGKVFDENFLMSIASIGAFLIGEHPEAVAVMLFYQVGEALQEKASAKSRKSITNLMDIRPDYANIEKDGKIIRVSPEKVKVGDIITVKNGERVPLDGFVAEGETFLDTTALTGESVPRKVVTGDIVLSGSINTLSPVRIQVEKEFSESTVSKILKMVESAQGKKAKSEKFITAFAKYYTPIVVFLAVIIMVFPPLLFSLSLSEWIYRGLIFLVVSCPCALVVSIPLGFFAGIGCASKNGILVKGSSHLENLSKLDTVVFDKTGTLTKGTFAVKEIYSLTEKSELIKYAAYAEYYSNHPIAISIKEAYKDIPDVSLISDYTEIAGMGISAVIDGKQVLAGNEKLMLKCNVNFEKADKHIGSVIYVAIESKFAGYIVISDELKPDSASAIESLERMNIKTVMLTGDVSEAADYVASQIGIGKVYSQLLPQDKVAKLEEIISAKNDKKKVAFVGDGINDAPVLMRSDIGIAMGGIGSDSAIEAADVVLMTDEPSKIYSAVKISSRTMSIIKQNIVFAIGIKVLVMLLSIIGYSTMWLAIFADVGVSLLAVLNALRALSYKNK